MIEIAVIKEASKVILSKYIERKIIDWILPFFGLKRTQPKKCRYQDYTVESMTALFGCDKHIMDQILVSSDKKMLKKIYMKRKTDPSITIEEYGELEYAYKFMNDNL